MAWLFQGIFALDRAMRLFPSLIQVWFVEFFLIVPLAFFVAKLIDIKGGFGCPGEPSSIGGTMWGALALSLLAGFFFIRNLVRPRIREVSWTPMVDSGLGVGGWSLLLPNSRATVHYAFLSSHPSHALLLLITLWLPLALLLATENEGCSTLYWKAFGIAGLSIIAVMALLRVLAYYVFRFGRRDLRVGPARLGWEMGWRPTLSLVIAMHLIAWIPLGIMFWQDARRIAHLPVATATMVPGADRTYVRVEGTLKGAPVLRPVPKDNRGGNNYLSAAALVALDGGGEVLLTAKGSWVPSFIGALKAAKGGRIATVGALVQDYSKSDREYYAYSDADLPAPDPKGRVRVDMDTP
jgi:hypothetical protein